MGLTYPRDRMTEQSSVEIAKQVLTANEAVLYGIFGVIGGSGRFPPRAFLNEFLAWGSDPCDQDGRMAPWKPFALSADEYRAVFAWWVAEHPGAVEDDLGAECWADWVQRVREG
jgi:hypothetical protein